jgi:putative glutamine amidotransferase
VRWLITRTRTADSTERYRRWVAGAGVEPVIAGIDFSPPETPDGFDALLLSGGGDVNPALYGEKPHRMNSAADAGRDEVEMALARRFLDCGRPVFGICRGIQLLAVALGGGLIQHVPDALGAQGRQETHQASPGAGEDARHGLAVLGDSRLRGKLGVAAEVNSAHHQALDPGRIGRGLRATAASPAGIVEAVEDDGLRSPVLAVQWHPERMNPADPASGGLLDLMLAMCRESRGL